MYKHTVLVNDLVVLEDVCNGHCEYCLTGTSDYKKEHLSLWQEGKLQFNLAKISQQNCKYAPGNKLYSSLKQLMSFMLEKTPAEILKISGGEILLVPGILSFLQDYSKSFARVQILTNGYLLDKYLDEIHSIDNACLQISMDGHTLAMNHYRIKNSDMQNRMLSIIDKCEKLEIPLEINCVLTDANLGTIDQFSDFLKRYNNILLLPYPIRGKNRNDFFPKTEQIIGLERLMSKYKENNHILPPFAYLQHLHYFLSNGIRANESNCYIPRLIYQLFDDGFVTPCPNIWFKSLGNILDDSDKVFQSLKNNPFYTIVERNALNECQQCFTPWDILNLFIEDKISCEEIKKIHLYNHIDTVLFLQDAKLLFTKKGTVK